MDPKLTVFDFSRYENPYQIDRIKIIEELIPAADGANAVDIGCGPGYFSKMLSAKGWRTTAIDATAENIEHARQYAMETYLGDGISVLSKLPENSYRLVLALEIIEHMPKSHGEEFLRAITRVIEPNGTLIISTPNRFSPQGLGGYYWGEKIRRVGKWYAWDITHVHIYSSAEILKLLRLTGFVVNRVIGYYYVGSLPLIGRWRLPLVKSAVFPLNRFGFNIIIECRSSS